PLTALHPVGRHHAEPVARDAEAHEQLDDGVALGGVGEPGDDPRDRIVARRYPAGADLGRFHRWSWGARPRGDAEGTPTAARDGSACPECSGSQAVRKRPPRPADAPRAGPRRWPREGGL